MKVFKVIKFLTEGFLIIVKIARHLYLCWALEIYNAPLTHKQKMISILMGGTRPIAKPQTLKIILLNFRNVYSANLTSQTRTPINNY